MAGEWHQVRIADLGRVVTGRTPPGNDPAYYGGDVPFLTPSDMLGHQRVQNTARSLSPYGVQQLGRCLIPRGVAVSCIGWQMGKSIFIDRPTITNQQINSIIINDEIVDPLFVYYSLLGRRAELFNLGAGGSRTPILNKGDFERLPFLLPPLPEQRAIAHILGTLDDKIELNRRMNETLEAMARALFKSWFVDFDPVRDKMEGRDPGLPKPLADLFPARLVDSELGEIPAGWEVGPIFAQAELLSGGTPKTNCEEYWGGSIPWASAKDVSQCGEIFLVATDRSITDKGLEESATQLIPVLATAVVARGATTGRMALLGRQMAMNQTCYALATTLNTPFALHCQIRSRIDQLVHAAHGSVFDTITTSTFDAARFVLPPKSALRVFERLVTPTFERILAASEESRTLAALRDTLLPKLISGELRVKDADKLVEAAT